MNPLQSISTVAIDDITSLVARKTKTSIGMVWPFADSTDVLTSLLNLYYKPGVKLITAGNVGPDVEIAANRAEVTLEETIGVSPFSGDIDSVLGSVTAPEDMIYVANPNRITGANFSLSELEHLAQTVPNGALIIDEYYNDHFGLSGFSLLESYSNIVILRSFAASFGIRSSDAGYLLAAQGTIDHIKEDFPEVRLSTTKRKTILATLVNDFALQNHLKEVHDEGLRIATELNRLGVQCRLTATDFILLRVADPASVGNNLARAKVTIENLDGYQHLSNYVKYQIQSPLSNDAMIGAFKRMPSKLYRMKSFDRRAVKMRLDKHTAAPTGNRFRQIDDPVSGTNRHQTEQSLKREIAYAAERPTGKRPKSRE
ncbi:MAG: hypothetical protein DRP47_00340 [Candidatus Zixiibacteriota bacterium]|nr:MAG: hypothetical protein DRP47_00340 [candidate division Zixibacteria bacterium]